MGKYNAIKQNITQVVLIVFSVVLGLYLSERIEERKNKKASDNLLVKVKSEVKDNMKLVEYWSSYHKEIYINLDSLSRDEMFIEAFKEDKSIFYEKLLTRGSFMGIFPASDAWDIAKSHPLIVNFDYDKMVMLSKIYNQQKITFEPGMEMLKTLSSKDVNTEKDVRSNLVFMAESMHELVARENQLMNYYREAEEKLDLFIKLSVSELKSYAGNYWNEKDAFARKIYVKNDTLRYFRNEKSENTLMPISANEFKMINIASDVRVTFDNKEIRSMAVTIDGRKPEILNEFQPIVYTTNELTNFEGRYYNEEIDEFYSLKLEKSALTLYVNNSKKSPLKSIRNNLFLNDDYGTFQFSNDEEGKLSGFQLVDGQEKNLVFEKK